MADKPKEVAKRNGVERVALSIRFESESTKPEPPSWKQFFIAIGALGFLIAAGWDLIKRLLELTQQ